MRVALSFPGCHRRGGVERIMVECANFLQERGHETHVYATDWDETVLNSSVIRHHVPARNRPSIMRLITYARESRRAMERQRPAPDVAGGYGVLSPSKGVVWVQSVHRAWLEISSSQRDFKGRMKQKLNLAHPLILAMERDYFGGRRYRKLIALSEQVKADLMRFYQVPAEDIVIIPNGFSPTEFSLDRRDEYRDAMRQQLGYRESDRVVIFAANELERKGFGPLLRAIAGLGDENIHLLAVGRLDSTAYAAEIHRLGMSGRVRFPGSTGEVAKYYAAADVFALPTQYEAWGLVIVEAMACGLPALTSRLAGAAVAVREKETGDLLDDPRDAAEIATRLKPLLAGAHASRETIADSVAEYAWPCVLLRYEDLLERCATSPVGSNRGSA
jgi:UDP-glucose:(heptosyl)LPS alpha-1,3-glucosyltransferase